MRKLLKRIMGMTLAASAVLTAVAAPASADWEWTGGNWRYRLSANGGYIKSRFQQLDGAWYMFDQNGNMVTGWYNLPGTHKWYYLQADGKAVISDWVFDNGWYYIGADGLMVTGWHKVDGIWYYFLSGRMSVGWTRIVEKGETHWYYFNSDGSMRTSQWVNDNGKRYYLDKDGRMLSGCTATIDGASYTFEEDGSVVNPSDVVYQAMEQAVLKRHQGAQTLIPSAMELNSETLADAFGIDQSSLNSCSGEMAMLMTNCDMLLVVEAKDGKASQVKAQMEKALQSRVQQFEWYGVMGNSERCAAAKVVSQGNFVALVMVGVSDGDGRYDCSGDVAAAVKAFNQAARQAS